LKPKKNSAFTLVEMLAVIAIVGMLAGILLPAIGAVRSGAMVYRTRLQLHSIAVALGEWTAHYGFAPKFLADGKPIAVNGAIGQFVQTLQGVDGDGGGGDLNPDNVRFYTFGGTDFDGDGRLVDAFGGSEIYAIGRPAGKLAIPPDNFPPSLRQVIPPNGVTAPFAVWSVRARGGQAIGSWQ
jgi:prepilin-type N-terminal cleavage/methylation domain-containing protein